MMHLENARVLPLVSLFWLLGRLKSPNVPRKDVILLRQQGSGSRPLFSLWMQEQISAGSFQYLDVNIRAVGDRI